MRLNRKHFCRASRHRNRRLNRWFTRLTPGGRRIRPNYISEALSAFGRAIRAHRRLMKLAPRIFDYGIVHRETLERAREQKRRQEIEMAIRKVYGPDIAPGANENRCKNGALLVQNLSPEEDYESRLPKSRRARRAVAEEEIKWEWGLKSGGEALRLYHERTQHQFISLGTIARMLDTATILGRLSCGLETNAKDPPPQSNGYLDFEAACQKIYGSSTPDADGA